jgi:hypothetical protein
MTDILVRVKSVFFVELPVSDYGKSGWVNLALVRNIEYSVDDGFLRLTFIDGSSIYENGPRAKAIVDALREETAKTSL